MAKNQKSRSGIASLIGDLGGTGIGFAAIPVAIGTAAAEGTAGAAAITSALALLGGSMGAGIMVVAAIPVAGAAVGAGAVYGATKLIEHATSNKSRKKRRH